MCGLLCHELMLLGLGGLGHHERLLALQICLSASIDSRGGSLAPRLRRLERPRTHLMPLAVRWHEVAMIEINADRVLDRCSLAWRGHPEATVKGGAVV